MNATGDVDRERTLIVGLDEPEFAELQKRIDGPVVAYEFLPRIYLKEGQLFVESRNHTGRFLKVDRVLYHGIYENDFDFITLLALWGGPTLPHAAGMMDCRLRHSGLVRALQASRFHTTPRGMVLNGDSYRSEGTGMANVAKWGNWHCGENKVRFEGEFAPPETALIEPFIEGEALRIVILGEKVWQIELKGEDWLKSIHHPDAGEMRCDPVLAEDARNILRHLRLELAGIDYIRDREGGYHLLEVNHIPNVTRFSFMRDAYLDMAARWCRGEERTDPISSPA